VKKLMDMVAHRVGADHECLGDFFIALALGKQNQHIQFTRGEFAQTGINFMPFGLRLAWLKAVEIIRPALSNRKGTHYIHKSPFSVYGKSPQTSSDLKAFPSPP